MNTMLLTSDIRTESDVVFVRQRARQIAALLEFDAHDQTRISTAVSEIARNAFLYAQGGRAQFSIAGGAGSTRTPFSMPPSPRCHAMARQVSRYASSAPRSASIP